MQNISAILIANRGEIASRIMRTCQKMGIKSVAVFSDADRTAPFVRQADTAVFIGESTPAASYLDQEKIIATAKKIGADAIHPGYGFLSENEGFARKCALEGIIFIGPNPDAIAAMGSKSKAKSLMQQHAVPIVPGYQGRDQSVGRLTAAAKEIGFPVLLKATAGGGGKGMRIVHHPKEIEKTIEAAKRESLSAFGDDELIVEKYVASGRHIEFQIFGDQHGNAIHILERECSIQRRYQKVLEESPSPVMDEALREKMGAAAVNAAKALSYDNAGTVEFIYDDQSGDFYFLEVNTRLQVEHPVTEMVTDLDLVQMQIESAQGMPLSITQAEVQGNGYALEARLYAEDAANDFMPVTGKIIRFDYPKVDGLRVESAIESGSDISVFYDPMIAKIIVHDQSRAAVMRKMQYVLRNMVCQGITTNQDFLLKVVKNVDFQNGQYDTHFIQNKIDLSTIGLKTEWTITIAGIAATLYRWQQRNSQRTLLRSMPSGWRNNYDSPQFDAYLSGEADLKIAYRFRQNQFFYFYVNDREYTVQLVATAEDSLKVEMDGVQYLFNVAVSGNNYFIHNEQIGNIPLVLKDRFPVKEVEKIAGGYETPMPSQIVKILVETGQRVEAGQGLVVLSSMKMESTVEAVSDGKVAEIYATEGENVAAGFLLLKMESV
ncbi:MAG: biotin carboxylase N-terminal domain-containing protein [Bacteroidota bacterium]